MGIQVCMGNRRLPEVGLQNKMLMISEVNARTTEVWKVERTEGTESICILSRTAIATQQTTIEINIHLWNDGCSVLVMSRSQFDA